MFKKILVTGGAGFIGYHLTKRLVLSGYHVSIFDNVNDYYNVGLKFDRLKNLGFDEKKLEINKKISSSNYPNLWFYKVDITCSDLIMSIMLNERFDCVVNLAAQAGVRYSLENPFAYVQSNVLGFTSILEGSRKSDVKHLIYASTSSVYGLNNVMPLSELSSAEHPVSFYAATKKANEMMAHSYSHLFGLPTTGLRFFTVYGPWGRPDMALFLFTKAITEGRKINVFNKGEMLRDFTYVDDIVESIVRLIDKVPLGVTLKDNENLKSNESTAPFKIFNIGNGSPVNLLEYVEAIENSLGMKAQMNMMEMQPGDVASTHADTDSLSQTIGFKPNTSVKNGIAQFIDWYKSYYNRV